MLGLGIGYFLSFTPFTALARGVSEGLLPGIDHPVKGLELLPPAALGLLTSMVVFLLVSRWWRYARARRIGGLRVPFPGRETAMSAFFMAIIVGTTILNFTFVGISILFVLVLERLETLVLAPSVDLIRRRKIRIYCWVALALCAVAAVVTLTDVTNYRLTLAAAVSIVAYLAGYTGRFSIMSKHAKTGTLVDRRYFVEEHMTTPVALVAILAVFAIIGQGPAMHALRDGFTTFLTTPAAPWAFGIGVCYEALFIFTTHIFLDRREFAFGMPVHVCASLLAGVAATFLLRALYGTAAPSSAQFIAAACVIVAAIALSYPALRAWWAARQPTAKPLLLFVCGGNTCRSAMAEAISRTTLADRWRVASAGLNATSGASMDNKAVAAVADLGIPTNGHHARQLTPDMIAEASTVYCMTAAQRNAVLTLVPDAANKTIVLDPDGDLPDPHGQSPATYRKCADRIRHVIRARAAEPNSRLTVSS
jgi:protein-tyrosine-phosphatase